MNDERHDKPVLWHIPVSHYSEKARWALAYKSVEHERRAPPPGVHIPVAIALTRSLRPTFPVLQLDGRGIGDSTAIIAALEERYADRPPLYPPDPGERRRALELEDYFDEQLGPQIRLLAWHDLIGDSGDGMGPVAAATLPERLRDVAPLRAGADRLRRALREAALPRLQRRARRRRAHRACWRRSTGSSASSTAASTWSATGSRSPT